MSDKGDTASLSIGEVKILAIKRRSVNIYLRHTCATQKGLDDQEWSVRRLIQCLEFPGYMRFSIKSDKESAVHSVVDKAIVYLGRIVEGWRPEQLNVENSPVEDSQSNATIERGIQFIQGQVRTVVSALQSRIGVRIQPDDCVLSWLIMYAGETLSHHQVGSDRRVAFQRLREQQLKRRVVEFGERILWQPLDTIEQGKLNPRWIEGVWLGVRPQTSEVIVGTDTGVSRTREFGWVPQNQR